MHGHMNVKLAFSYSVNWNDFNFASVTDHAKYCRIECQTKFRVQ
jgi:hypothetical protein